MKKVQKLIILIIILGLIAGGIYYYKSHQPKSNELTLFGNVEIRQVDLSFQVAGRILKMLKEEGDSVKSGELVALMDDRDYKADFAKNSAEVDRTKAVSANASSQYERQAPLCIDDTVSRQDCETLLNTKKESKAAYESAVASKQDSKNKLDYTKVYAPEDGIITTRIQEPGANVTVGQPIYTLSKNKPIWIRAYVPETQLGNIKYGMKAKVLTDSIDPKTGKNREYEGWVGYISPVAEFTPKTVQTEDLRTDLVYRIRVYVYDIDPYLRQGMPTTIKINLVSASEGNHQSDAAVAAPAGN